MPTNRAGLVSSSLAVLSKDLRQELRQRFAVNAFLLFGVITVVVIAYAIGPRQLDPAVAAALYWVAVFFAAMAGLAHVFVREEETGTSLALRLHAPSDAVLIGKFLFQALLLLLLAAVITPLYFVLTAPPDDVNLFAFLAVVVLGLYGLAAATTLVAAIIARTGNRGALFSVMAFPILLPLLMVLVVATGLTLQGAETADVLTHLQFLFAYAVVMTTGSVMLFRYVWHA